MSDPYIESASGILRNKLGLKEQQSLDTAEADLLVVRETLFDLNPPKGNFDSQHLKAIHAYLFRDVYDWAGQFRIIPLAKAEYERGGKITRFSAPESIEHELEKVFTDLANQNFLQELQRKEFSRRIAVLFSEINRIHAFREGNGRTQRQFVRQLAKPLGYNLDFDAISRERLVQASVLSANGDLSMMERLMDEITDTVRVEPLKKVIQHLKRNGFNWNDVYIATTTPGQTYSGTFAGTDGTNFFFRDNQDHILVGNLKDLKATPKTEDRINFVAT
jgi:cell filamentation protein